MPIRLAVLAFHSTPHLYFMTAKIWENLVFASFHMQLLLFVSTCGLWFMQVLVYTNITNRRPLTPKSPYRQTPAKVCLYCRQTPAKVCL